MRGFYREERGRGRGRREAGERSALVLRRARVELETEMKGICKGGFRSSDVFRSPKADI